MKIIERIKEHYDVEEVKYGKIYKWCPECIVVECECTRRWTLTRSELLSGSLLPSTCECGKDHMSAIRQEIRDEEVVGHRCFEDDQHAHPWRYWHTSEDAGLPR